MVLALILDLLFLAMTSDHSKSFTPLFELVCLIWLDVSHVCPRFVFLTLVVPNQLAYLDKDLLDVLLHVL